MFVSGSLMVFQALEASCYRMLRRRHVAGKLSRLPWWPFRPFRHPSSEDPVALSVEPPVTAYELVQRRKGPGYAVNGGKQQDPQ